MTSVSARCPVPGAWCPVPGARCLVPGARCPVPKQRPPGSKGAEVSAVSGDQGYFWPVSRVPLIAVNGTAPKSLESMDTPRLSPSTKTLPAGTRSGPK